MASTLASRASQHCTGLSPRSSCLSGPHTRHPHAPHSPQRTCTPTSSPALHASVLCYSFCLLCPHGTRGTSICPSTRAPPSPPPVTHSPRRCFCFCSRFPPQEGTDPRAANQGLLPSSRGGCSRGTWQPPPPQRPGRTESPSPGTGLRLLTAQ